LALSDGVIQRPIPIGDGATRPGARGASSASTTEARARRRDPREGELDEFSSSLANKAGNEFCFLTERGDPGSRAEGPRRAVSPIL